MSSKSRFPEGGSATPLVEPYQRSLDRMQQQAPPRPEYLTDRARAVLAERGGRPEARPEAAFAHTALGLLAGHSNYFDGFAVLMTLPHGTAVAVCERDGPVSRLFFDGRPDVWTFDRLATDEETAGWPVGARLVAGVMRRLGVGTAQVDVAVAGTAPPACVDAYLAVLGVAAVRAAQALYALPERTVDLLPVLRQLIVQCIDAPFSIAYLLASEAGRPGEFILVDTATREYLSLEAPAPDVLGWGLVEAGNDGLVEVAAPWKRKAQADRAVEILQQHGFKHLTSLRDLEHRDLQRAVDVLPHALKPVVRHLVTENRRVQKLVVAIRRRDWQLFGALLLMSHAALRSDWRRISDETELVVAQVEAMSLDGIYGACVTGRSHCVLVLGQPFAVPRCFDRVQAAYADRFGRTPTCLLL